MPRPRKIAPSVTVTNYSGTDERQELVRMYAPDCVSEYKWENGKRVCTKKADFSAYFDDPKIPEDYYRRRGYVPVTMQSDDKGGAASQVTHKGDRLWKRRADVTQKELDRSAERGRMLVEAAKTPGSPEYADGQLVEVDD